MPFNDSTLSLHSTRTAEPGTMTSWLFLVFRADRPLALPTRYNLRQVDEVRIKRGKERHDKLEELGGRTVLTVQVDDPSMSSNHARLVPANGRWWLQDQSSKNGSFVNGVQVRSEDVMGTALDSATFIQLSQCFFLYREALSNDSHASGFGGPLGGLNHRTMSPLLASQFKSLELIAATDVSVVLLGETGTGKEVAARAIHASSGRKGAFVAINCGTLNSGLSGSELFGHVRGGFTDAVAKRVGAVASANRGTLLLDEIGDMPLAVQGNLLRVLQEKEVTPIGSSTPESVDIRVISATHRDLDKMVDQGSFRGDLLARLSGFVFRLPPLRERASSAEFVGEFGLRIG